jgi:hemolysin activation/secretion protein
VVGKFTLGPIVTWADPQPAPGSPAMAAGGVSFMNAGIGFGVDLDGSNIDPVPSHGWRLRGNLAAYPFALRNGSFTSSSFTGSTYMPLYVRGSTMAFRIGGSLASGDFPSQYAAFVGGSNTVRGFAWQRFAGDRAASASTELRVPLGVLNFLVKSDVGAIGFVDAGRVWFDGQNDGSWHTGVGGGLWFAALGRALSVTYARGEEGRFYLKTGLPF